MTLNDVTPLEGVVMCMHTITATAYVVLAHKIFMMKRYLKWNKHIYPTIMYGSTGLGAGLFWLLSTSYFLGISTTLAVQMILIFLGMLAICYAVAAEAVRLAHKYDKIQELEKQVKHKDGIIESIKKKRGIILLALVFILLGCGGLKKEIERLESEKKVQTEQYEKTLSELNEKIKEVEKRETTTQTELMQKVIEVETLKKEKEEVQSKLDELQQEDIIIENADGNVKITDHKGNTYEIPSSQGTTISKSSLTKLSQQLNSVRESLSQATERAQILTKNIFTRDKTIKEKESEIKAKNERINELENKVSERNEQLSKEITKKGTPFYIWIIVGMFLMVAIQILIKAYNPFNKLKSLWKQL